jgi:hypothetical protein
MNRCVHTPRCSSASVHHARTQLDLRDRERKRDAATTRSFAELRDSLATTAVAAASPASKRRSRESAFGRAPWELSANEFDAVAELFIQLQPTLQRDGFPISRTFGLTVSTTRFGLRLRLKVFGGPEDGYVADIDWSDTASLDDPRRAFVVDALAHGQCVPPDVLADYPDLIGIRPA